jgi:hypothetical protein
MKVLETNSATVVASKPKQNPKANDASSPIRVKQSTRRKLDELLRRANKQKLGRKVKTDDLICFSLGLLYEAQCSESGDLTF